MKANIHPQWNHQTVVTCSCGNTFTTGSMQPTITVDICSKCHPFFTGEMKFVDRQGRVDKFKHKVDAAAARQAAVAAKQASKKAQTAPSSDEPELSYKQLLQQEQNKMRQMKKAVAA